jgi:hypothetical protein
LASTSSRSRSSSPTPAKGESAVPRQGAAGASVAGVVGGSSTTGSGIEGPRPPEARPSGVSRVAADPLDRQRNRRIVRIGLRGALQVLQRRLHIAGAEIEESDSLERPRPHGIEPERVGPGVEGAGQVALVAQDPAQEVGRPPAPDTG